MAKRKSSVTVSLPSEMIERVEEWAQREDKNFSAMVARLVEEALEQRNGHKTKEHREE